MMVADEQVLNELHEVEIEWTRGCYVEWKRRQQVLRLAKIGATFERVAQESKGPIGAELRSLIASVDAHV